MQNSLPTRETDYRAVAELGRGGQAVVTLCAVNDSAKDTRLVVVKRVRNELAEDPRYRQAFEEQGRLMALLNHPNVLRANGFLNDRGQPVLATEYLQGQPLSKVIEKSQAKGHALPLALHLYAISEAVRGLAYIHGLEKDGKPLHLMHRDVSPRTMFITYDGEVKLLDFGVACLNAAANASAATSIRGKATYTAPEQFTDQPLDQRADVYAVGVVLWEALAERRMWTGTSEADLVRELCAGRVPAVLEANPKAPKALAQICTKALAPEADDRYPSAVELLDTLEKAMKEARLLGDRASLSEFISARFADKRAQAERLLEAELRSLKSATESAVPQSPRARKGEPKTAAKPKNATDAHSQGPEVLVIDDSELSREIICDLLKEAHIDAIATPTAVGAMKKVIRRNISVVITDVNMPKLTGNDLVSQLRRNPKTRDAKVVLVSALPPKELYEVGRRVRADGIIEKDRLDEELVPIVNNLLRHARYA